jgi:uncharacterized protein
MSDINDQLIHSIVQGNLLEVQALLEQGADANTSGVKALGGCNTALMWAAAEGHEEIALLLLDRGAAINVKNTSDYNALMYAAEADKREIMTLLLDRGAEINDRNRLAETVLMSIARFGQTDIVQRLVTMGAEINAVNKIVV